MLPKLDPSTGYLPPGLHPADWSDLTLNFASNSHRALLVSGLLSAVKNLVAAGSGSILVDGSFVTAKVLPQDFDATWDPRGVDFLKLDPVLLDFSNKRAAMKAKYFGELFPGTAIAAPGKLFRDFFLTDRNGIQKGVLDLNLRSLP